MPLHLSEVKGPPGSSCGRRGPFTSLLNAHINHDPPIAAVGTCAARGTAPDAAPHFADFQKVDQLLDAAEQSVRQSFETAAEKSADQHLGAVANLIANWSINSARDLAWTNCLLLWSLRDDPLANSLFQETLAASTALTGRLLLVALWHASSRPGHDPSARAASRSSDACSRSAVVARARGRRFLSVRRVQS